MLVLALDTATSAVTAGLLRLPPRGQPELLAERATVDPKAHAELLMPSVRAVLDQVGARLAELGAVVCGVGPGPFTGLRVGVVTAAALGDALRIPAYPVCTLDAVAHRAGAGSPLVVATDARRREVYWARYDEHGTRVAGPAVNRPAEVATDGAARAAGVSAEALGLPVVAPAYPDPAALVAVAADQMRAGGEPGPLRPLYLRRPDAAEPGPRKRVTPV